MKREIQVELAADVADLCGECPLWHPQSSSLLWTDCVGGRFHRLEPATGRILTMKSPLPINSFRLNAGGGYAICTNSGVFLWNGGTEVRKIVTEIAGGPCSANDCCADSAGRLISATMRYDDSDRPPPGLLFAVDPNGSVRVLDEGFALANGLAFAPDGRTLYLVDSAARVILAYDYEPISGTVAGRRVFAVIHPDDGIPDGLAVDAAGFVWVALWYGGMVLRFDPDGREETCLAVPAQQVSSLAFGGPDLTDLYFTSAGGSFPTRLIPASYDSQCGTLGGGLFRARAGVAGMPPSTVDLKALESP